MKRLLTIALMALLSVTMINAQQPSEFSSQVVADEGAWCWFADPRALHYENADGSIKNTYIGYIDVHGNVKATQYDWLKHRKTDVLVRSNFQPDDHNNPTFIVLPDERVMIFYTRHTDEPKIWYRISTRPGDITSLDDEKYLSTANNTTYPSPFILSDDPDHIYLCWRGINWHPTIARLTMPDADDNCQFDFGPKQIVQSTGARPYAKYQSNGKDKIYVSYTTGHPDNEMPDWLYFNVIDINKGNGPILRDLNGKQLSVIKNGVFNVSKTDSYASQYPATIVDKTANIRNWVWQITLDKDENPVIAYPHIDDAKTTHVYWYARWTGTAWRNTWVQYGGHAFHHNWNSTERCYSGGMAVDPDNVNDLYLSIPTKNGAYNKDGVYEIWKYTIEDDGKVAGQEQLTKDSPKNNARPFIIPGSKNSPMRLVWMQGDYYYWIVTKGYPKGYPTAIHADYQWTEPLTLEPEGEKLPDIYPLTNPGTLTVGIAMDAANYQGTILALGEGEQQLTYSLDATDKRPVVSYGGKSWKSQNKLYTSDDWALYSTGTSGDDHPTKLTTWVLTLTYDGQTLTTYRNGLVDQVIEIGEIPVMETNPTPCEHEFLYFSSQQVCHSPMGVQQMVAEAEEVMTRELGTSALELLELPVETRTDLVLPSSSLGLDITWTSSDETVIAKGGTLSALTEDKEVTLTAAIGETKRTFVVKGLKRDIPKNLRYEQDSSLDLSGNRSGAFSTNKYGQAPEGLLSGLRSYTFLVTVKPSSLSGQPRIYDFGSGSGNSVFLRANKLSAGVKYNGGTTVMVDGNTQLKAGQEYKIAVSFNAATRTTKIFVDGQEDASTTSIVNEPYMLAEIAKDSRNYIGRTQWWDGAYANDNQDFIGTIDGLRLYDVCLTQEEICELQGIGYQQKELPTALENGDFEKSYDVQSGSGVSSDRAIYIPESWTVERSNPNANDITALKSGDLYFDRFFGTLSQPTENGRQTYWVRQNWGTPTLTLSQELRLPEGEYTLTASVWKSGLGGDAVVSVETENGAVVTAPSLENKSEWQMAELTFSSDGKASTTVRLQAVHTADGSEKIIGFDNVVITKKEEARLKGDVNRDGKVDISDIVAIINQIAGTALYENADVNEDNKVDISDIVAVINEIAGKE